MAAGVTFGFEEEEDEDRRLCWRRDTAAGVVAADSDDDDVGARLYGLLFRRPPSEKDEILLFRFRAAAAA